MAKLGSNSSLSRKDFFTHCHSPGRGGCFNFIPGSLFESRDRPGDSPCSNRHTASANACSDRGTDHDTLSRTS